MRALLFTVLPFWLSAQTWQQVSDFPGSERDDGVAFTLGNNAYYGTGMNGGFEVTRDFYAFDPNTESWSAIAPLPEGEARQYACAFSLAGKAYVFGGIDAQGNSLNDLWRYSPQSDSWTPLFGLPAGGRSGMSCFVLADTAYIVGGKNQAGEFLDEVWAYVISSNGWLPMADLPEAMWRGMSFSYNGKGYAGLGANTSGLNPTVFRYLPSVNTWETVSGLTPEPRSYPQIAIMSNQVYLFGGQDDAGYRTSLERIDLSTWNIATLSNFPVAARRGGSSFAFGADFYTVGGVTTTARQKESWVARGALALKDLMKPEPQVWISKEKYFTVGDEWPVEALEIRNVSGNLLYQGAQQQVDVSGFAQGIYFYRFQLGEDSHSGKIAIFSFEN